MNQLIFTVEPDCDGDWRIGAEVTTENFSGRGWCWGSPDELTDFASALAIFPLAKPAELRMGYGALQSDDLIIDIRIRQVSAVGALEAKIEIANSLDPFCRVKTKLMTSYASLDRFMPQLVALAAGKRDTAVLLGS